MYDINYVLKHASGILATTIESGSDDTLNERKTKYTPLTKAKLIELLKTDYSTAFKKVLENKIIFRGVSDDAKKLIGKYSLLKPGLRISRYARYNLYNRLFSDILPSWRGYPPRNRSFTCSTSTSYAVAFTSDEPTSFINVYTVLPKNGAVIGVCPSTDLWGSFKYLVENEFSLDDFQYMLMGVIEFIGKQLDEVISIKTNQKSTEFSKVWQELDKATKYGSAASITAVFDSLSKKLETYINDVLEKVKREYPVKDELDHKIAVANATEEMLEEMKKRNSTSILKILDDFFNPKINGIKKVTIEQYSERSYITTKTDTKHSGKEVWTDSECIFTKLKYLKSLL